MFPHVHGTFDSPLMYTILFKMEISLKLKEKEIIPKVNNIVLYLLAKLKPLEQKEHFSQKEQNGLGGI